ncbi:MAG: hypothetical protein AAF231_07500 [Pseudomonadota bacterium]
MCNDTCALGFNLLVPVSSFYDGCDVTCELDKGDHPFLNHLSYVFYAKAGIYRAKQISAGLQAGIVEGMPELADAVFQRVATGLCASPDTPRKVKTYFGC